MKKLLYIILFITFFASQAGAQNAIFLKQGRIEFEKKENLWARIDSSYSANDGGDNTWRDFARKAVPQFRLSYFNLFFNGNRSLYAPGKEGTVIRNGWDEDFSTGSENIVFSNTETQQLTAQKSVFRETFLIQDSLRQIKWKITDETRNIAGFECRRANALIMDSLYVVAFYTDAITISSGPEYFTGLPGTILGVSIPHEHISWFATKVFTDPITDAQLKVPTSKGKKYTNASLLAFLKENMKDWGGGRWVSKNIQAIMY